MVSSFESPKIFPKAPEVGERKEAKELAPQEIAEQIKKIPDPEEMFQQAVKSRLKEEGLEEESLAYLDREKEVAKELAPEIIEQLQKERFLIIPRRMRGLERCDHCGENVNMGGLQVIENNEDVKLNFDEERRKIEINFKVEAESPARNMPYIALHSLEEHHSAEFQGTTNKGKVDLEKWSEFLKVEEEGKTIEGK